MIDRDTFVQIISYGYPMNIQADGVEELYMLIEQFFTDSENHYLADVTEHGVAVYHRTYSDYVCLIHYELKANGGILRVKEATDIELIDEMQDDDEHTKERIKILGIACFGLVKFCQFFEQVYEDTFGPQKKPKVTKPKDYLD